ncbi:PsiF family protein [Eleftheria terrae]|uniref:PsiF family protein n=1 Tax=Eleftheria terrae TaxID=1597781 RepID=UPI00263B2B25|nr:PsiF family protein [Eleftheria terrae]WKB54979.1 PsiF family protein [Eleftheria terrae]
MNYTSLSMALLLAVASGWAAAQDNAPAAAASAASATAPTAQQNKMAVCNQEAAGKKGEERKAFMKDCLTDKKKAQQNKMTRCNAEAKGMKGDERKAFMSECLKK